MSNHGKRMVKENLIAQIGQGGGAEYTAGTGIDITEDVISVDTTAIQEKLTAGDNITISEGVISATDTTYDAGDGINISAADTITVDMQYVNSNISVEGVPLQPTPVTVGPAFNDEAVITAWVKSLPVLMGRGSNSASQLQQLGFTNLVQATVGQEVLMKGYFAVAIEDGSSPYAVTKVVVCTTENRTGSSSIVGKNNTNSIKVIKTANQSYMSYDSRFRGTNTSLTAGIDPVSLQALEVYAEYSSPNKYMVFSLNNTKPFHVEEYFGWKIGSPTSDDYSSGLAIPSTDGTYTLKVTVTSGVPVFE